MNTTLSTDKTECTVDGITLRLHQQIQYKIPSEAKVDDGKIEELKYAPESESVWMRVISIRSGDTYWLSVAAWKEMNLKITELNTTDKPW